MFILYIYCGVHGPYEQTVQVSVEIRRGVRKRRGKAINSKTSSKQKKCFHSETFSLLLDQSREKPSGETMQGVPVWRQRLWIWRGRISGLWLIPQNLCMYLASLTLFWVVDPGFNVEGCQSFFVDSSQFFQTSFNSPFSGKFPGFDAERYQAWLTPRTKDLFVSCLVDPFRVNEPGFDV